MQQQGVAYQSDKFGQTGAYAQKQEELLAPIREKVKKAIQEVATTDGIDVVFDRASPAQDILFASDKLDITFKVLDTIKRGKVSVLRTARWIRADCASEHFNTVTQSQQQ